MNIEERTIAVIICAMGMQTGEVDLESSRESLEMDSLDDIEMLMCLEEEFGIEISDAQAETITTVQSAVDLIKTHLDKAP